MKQQLLQKIRDYVNQPDYRPHNKSELARALAVGPKQRPVLREVLNELVADGTLQLGKKSRYQRVREKEGKGELRLEGIVKFSPKDKTGSGSFFPDNPQLLPEELRRDGITSVFVGRRGARTAIEGDHVMVKLVPKGPPKWHKYVKQKDRKGRRFEDKPQFEAVVVEVLERKLKQFVGTYHRRGHSAAILPENPRLPRAFRLSKVLKGARPGDMVVAEFLDWTDPRQDPVARMVEVLGAPDQPGIDILSIIHKHELPLEFPKAVMAEAEAVDENIPEEELAIREDWRDREVFTIDPVDARDFDDAISVVELPDGGWELGVHIADVSHYVKPGSALDKEAQKRGNSVYLVDRVIPMLPEKLSNGVCSLNPHVDRLTQAVVIQFSPDGTAVKTRFSSSVIRSGRRYTYEEAFTILGLSDKAAAAYEDKTERRYAQHIKRAWKLTYVLRQRRFRAGCLDLDFPEIRAVLNKNGKAVDVRRSENDESHQLIEEFMLAANEAVARETKRAGVASIYRVHESPDLEKLEDFADEVRSYGYQISDPSDRAEVQKLTKAMRGSPEEHSLKISLLKCMNRACYSKEPTGHYGLAKADYSHFTSPIRRYADLIAHRVLRKLCSRRGDEFSPDVADKTPPEGAIAEIATYISKTERSAADAEMETQRLKMLEYIEYFSEKNPEATFEAFVFDTRPIGAFVELRDFLIKGLIRKHDMPSKSGYFFDRKRDCFMSATRKKKSIRNGQVVQVKLARVDRAKGFIDFTLVE
ncbi:MAG: ribonuclease R [Verrucomicrobiota bacterium]